MKKKKNFKFIKKSMYTVMLLSTLTTLSSCAKKVDCNIKGKHVHVYVNPNTNLCKYEKSEKEYIGDYNRTDSFLELTAEVKTILKKDLCLLRDNKDYIMNLVNEYRPKQQVYEYDYIYGQYTGYAYGCNPANGKYIYYYGTHYGYHYEWVWNDKETDDYTENKVRDVTYSYKLYKINKDGSVESKVFEDLENLEEGYNYFSEKDFIVEVLGEEYYMKPITKIKTVN